MGADAAGEELAELLLNELGQTGAVGTVGRFAKKDVQVGADNGVEDAALRVAWAVGRTLWGHEPQVGPESVRSQCRKGDTPNGLGARSGEPLPAGRLLSGTAPAARFALFDHAVLLAGGDDVGDLGGEFVLVIFLQGSPARHSFISKT